MQRFQIRFGGSGSTFGGRRLVWGSTPRARSVRPVSGSPFFKHDDALARSEPRGLSIAPAIAAMATTHRTRAA
jgi:hypothetical protein